MVTVGQYATLYKSKQWRRLRKDQLRRVPWCQMCDQHGRATPARIADHITPHRGNTELFFYGRLQSLCKHCHDSHKQRQERSGIVLGGDEQGIPTDKGHHWNE